jgi:hypothetical protein
MFSMHFLPIVAQSSVSTRRDIIISLRRFNNPYTITYFSSQENSALHFAVPTSLRKDSIVVQGTSCYGPSSFRHPWNQTLDSTLSPSQSPFLWSMLLFSFHIPTSPSTLYYRRSDAVCPHTTNCLTRKHTFIFIRRQFWCVVCLCNDAVATNEVEWHRMKRLKTYNPCGLYSKTLSYILNSSRENHEYIRFGRIG